MLLAVCGMALPLGAQPPSSPAPLTVLHPAEGAPLPPLSQVFVYGATVPGSTLTVNGLPVPVYKTGGYLTMIPLMPGDAILVAQAVTPAGETFKVERRFKVGEPFAPLPPTPLKIDAESIQPAADMLVSAGDLIAISFRGSPGAEAEFSIEDLARHGAMTEVPVSTAARSGFYQGNYVVQPGDEGRDLRIGVHLKRGRTSARAKAAGRISVLDPRQRRAGRVTEDIVAARTAPDGGYDIFLHKGMRLPLTGRRNGHWRVRFSGSESGWVRESAIEPLPAGAPPGSSLLTGISTSHLTDSAIARLTLSDPLPYRAEQLTDPPRLRLTLYGAAAKIDFIRYDPSDPLIRRIRWRQREPDALEITLEAAVDRWWGYDLRYEDRALIVEVREPWNGRDLRGMVIAVDAGHGGTDQGAMGPRGLLEKDANLAIAREVADALARAGAKPYMIRERDEDVPLYDRPRLAWRAGARLFVSLHCNSAGLWENPLWNNGASVYWHQPQSQGLAEAIHKAYRRHVPMLPDRGLFYADFAVCRMTQMPAVLVENAYLIVPDQEERIFDPKFQKLFAAGILQGVERFIAGP